MVDPESPEVFHTNSDREISKPLFPIQRPWLAGLLTASTFGFYLLFYLYIHVRDLKRLGKDYTPWLWLLSPLIPISSLFTFPRLASGYEAVGKYVGEKAGSAGLVAGLIVFVCLVIARLPERYLDGYSQIISLATLPLLFYAVWRITHHINVAKLSLPESCFSHPAYTLTLSSWIFGVIGLLLVTPLLVFLAYSELKTLNREKVDPATTWAIRGGEFRVDTQDKWAQVQIGEQSDGSATAEFALTDFTWALIFDHQGEQTPGKLARIRRADFLEEHPEGECSQRRWLQPGTLERRSELLCQSQFLGDPIVQMNLSIDDAQRHIEVYAYSNSAAMTLAEAKALVQRFGESVLLLDTKLTSNEGVSGE